MDEFCYGRILWLADEEELSRLILVNRFFSRIVRDRINSIKYDLTVPVQSMQKLIKRLCRERKIFSVKWFLDNTRLQSYILKWALKTANVPIGLFLLKCISHEEHSDSINYALQGGNMKLIRSIKNYTIKNDSLYNVCKGGNIEAIRFTLNHDYPIDLNYGLAGACYAGNRDVMKMMIKMGAKHSDWTCLNTCYSNDIDLFRSVHDIVCEELLRYEKNYIFTHACIAGNLDIIRYCYEKGYAHCLQKEFYDACCRKQIEVMRFLADKLADMGVTSCHCGKTVAQHFTGTT